MSNATVMRFVTTVGAALALTACTDSSGPSLRPGEGRLTLSVTGRAPAGSPQAAPETVELGSDVLVLQRVELVLKEIELSRVGDDDLCNGADDCEEVEVGPMLIDLPLGGGTLRRLQIPVAAGTYDEIEFDIHTPDDDDAADRDFLAAHPDLKKVSIRVRGTFNGTPFVYVTDLSVEQEADLSPPLVVGDGASAELTLIVDVRGWFLDSSRSRLVNPLSALKGQPNEGLVKENIKRSIDAEGDDDLDD